MAESAFTFGVAGEAVPQGSSRAFIVNGRAKVAPSNSNKLKPWRKKVTAAAGGDVFLPTMSSGPVRVSLVFTMERPKTVKRDLPTVRPDLDKLVRAVLDGLTDAKVYADDGQVVELRAWKVYGDAPGVLVRVEGLSSAERVAVWLRAVSRRVVRWTTGREER